MESIISSLNLVIIYTVFVAVMLILRVFLKSVSKKVNMLLWTLVALRLMCPFVITSSVGVVPEKVVGTAVIESGVISSDIPDTVLSPLTSEDSSIPLEKIAFSIWLFGSCLMLALGVKSYIRLRESAGARIRREENVYICDDIDNGFVLGLIRPKILVPSSADPSFVEHIVRHEKIHIKHKDHIWKVLSYVLLSVNWFNPLIWMAFICFSRDIELYCDEEATRGYSGEERASYAYALLNLASRKITPANVAFGEVDLETRIKALGRKNKHYMATGMIGVLAVLLVSAFFLTNAKAIYRSDWSCPEFEFYHTMPEDLNVEYSVYDYYSYNEFSTIRGNINGYLSSNWQEFSDSRDNISFRVEDCLYEPGNDDLVVYVTVFSGDKTTEVRLDCTQCERGGYTSSATILDHNEIAPDTSHPVYDIL